MTGSTRSGLDRRRFLTGAAGCAAGLGLASSYSYSARAADSLGAIAHSRGIVFGASLAVHELDRPHGEAYANMYARETRLVTSELEFKLSNTRPEPGAFDYTGAQRLIAWAQPHAIDVRAHTLIWDDDVPAWVKALPRDRIPALIEEIISSAAPFANAIRYWDVVNEPIGPWDHQPGNLRKGPYFSAMGEDYITAAFRAARARYGAEAVLVLNEAQCETDDELGATFRASLLGLLRRLKDRGAPINAVGLQSHLKLAAKYDLPKFSAFLADITSLGYDLHITELDVNDSGVHGTPDQRDRAVAKLYGDFLEEMLRHTAVKVVQTWQLSDATSWMQDKDIQSRMKLRADPRPLPYDVNFTRKRAWDAIAKALSEAPLR